MNPRLRRLQADYELVRDSLSGHPHITVEPVGEHLPPETYRIQYRVRGLYLEDSQPAYRDVHEIELMLPLRYPAGKPYAVPVTPIFHPNIKEYVCIADYWAAGTTLVDVIAKMGDMIQWRIYNIASPLDGVAARWARDNEDSGLFPLGEIQFGVEEVSVSLKGSGTAPVEEMAPPRPGSALGSSRQDGMDAPPARGASIAPPRGDEA